MADIIFDDEIPEDKPKTRAELVKEILEIIRDDGQHDCLVPIRLVDLVEQIDALVKNRGRRPGVGSSIGAQMRRMIEHGAIEEESLLKLFDITREDAMKRFKRMSKAGSNPQNRLWIYLDTDSGFYILKGRGAQPPNWHGWIV